MMGLYYAVQQPLQYIVGLSSETVIKSSRSWSVWTIWQAQTTPYRS